MKNKFVRALLVSALSIVPIVAIIFIFSVSNLSPLTKNESIVLGIGAAIMILGLALFQIGASSGLTKVGEYMGASLSKQKRLFIVIIFSLLLGALITCAEPSILIVSTQININKYLLIGAIALGVGVFVVIGVLRIFYGKSLKVWYLAFYFLVFAILCFLQIDAENAKFLPFIFDAGGITTGSATVPFILALGAGVATVRGGKKSSDDSFGLVGLASIGPIISMTVLILLNRSGFKDYIVDMGDLNADIFSNFKYALLYENSVHMGSFVDVALALAPIVLIFFIYDKLFIHLPAKKVGQLAIGFVFSYIGLVLFLTGVSASMAPIGLKIGQSLAFKNATLVFLLAFVIGLVTILCEPAVHVLTTQIETISAGQIKKTTVLITLSLGVGVAICLAAVRSVFKFSIMYYLVPGYCLSVFMMFLSPDLFTAIAFDSGGTASGPMAVSFVMPMIIGITSGKNAISDAAYLALSPSEKAMYFEDITNGMHCLKQSGVFYEQSFGVVALIALTPILAVQILGIISLHKKHYRLKLIRELVHDESDSKIINF